MKKCVFAVFLAALAPFSSAADAEAKFGEWFSSVNDRGIAYAATMNDSGGALMNACDPADGLCTWYVLMQTSCEQNSTYVSLVNSSQGSSAHNLTCEGALTVGGKQLYRYIISDPDTMDKVGAMVGMVGFAVPLDSGQFRVLRFSLSGSTAAVSHMRKLAEASPKNTKTKDLVL